jgi:hypothetical protein
MHSNSLKNLQKYEPGTSGNPNGRPARARLTEKFISDVAAAWEQHGSQILAGMVKRQPDRFADLCAKLIPTNVAVSLEARMPAALSHEDLEVFRAIKQALPDAGTREPGEVLNYVLEAIRSHAATKIIEG